MSGVCQVTGKRPAFGKQVSFSHKRSSRTWRPNLQRKRYWLAAEGRWVKLTVSTKGMRTINKHGIDAVVANLRARGVKV